MESKGKLLKLGIILSIIIAVLGVFVIVNADDSQYYVVDVINAKDTDEDCYVNDNIKIQKSILKNNEQEPYYDEKNLTYQLKLSNIVETSSVEVALILDTSYSIEVNDTEALMKSKSTELVNAIYNSNSNAKIQLFNAAGQKTNKLASDGKATMLNTINSLVTGDGSDITDGINAAQESFSNSSDVGKYMIIFTDATDYTEEAMRLVEDKNIKIISVLINNIVSNSYINSSTNEPLHGKVQMVYNSDFIDSNKLYNEFDAIKIARTINASLLNIEITDKFSYALKEYFDFQLVSLNEGNNIEITEDGYIWNIDEMKSGETRILQFKMNLKDGTKITDPQYTYHTLPVSDSIVVEYEAIEVNKESITLPDEYIPTIQICDKYSVTIRAVSEENSQLTIEGIEFQVTAKDTDGNMVYNKTLRTDSNGEVVIDNLKTTGTLEFEITPTVANISGYTETNTALIEITNVFGSNFTVDTIEWKDKAKINNNKRNITIDFPITTQKFELEVNLSEVNNSNAVIGNTQFRLIQPKLNNQYEMTAKYAETDSKGKLTFTPTIMTKAGTYEYILSQMTVQDGYTSMGNVTIRIKFDKDGNIVENGVKTVHNDRVTGERVGPSYAIIRVQNAVLAEDMFNLELNLVDADNSKTKLSGAEYNIEVTRVSGGQEFTNTYYNCRTNEKGKLLIDLPGNGNVKLRITQVKATTGYNIDEEAKIVVINRSNGTVKSVLQAYNEKSLSAIDANAYNSENKVIVNLTNTIKSEKNIIEVTLSDASEEDIRIPNMTLELVNTINHKVYTTVTGADGVGIFEIEDETQGDYLYKLNVISALPTIYENIAETSLDIHFDENKHIEVISDAWDEDSSNEEEDPLMYIDQVELVEEEGFAKYKAGLHLGVNVDIKHASYIFKLKLTDRDDTNKTLEGAKFDIQITSGDIVRTIKGRATDATGNISTKIILAEEIEILVKQTSAISGYKIDEQTKEILLTYRNGVLSFVDQSITNTTMNGNEVIYSPTNVRKSSGDVTLSLVINKEDREGFAVGKLPIRIYQETGTNAANGETSYIGTANGTLDENGNKIGSWISESGDSTNPIALTASNSLNVKTMTDNLGTVVLEGLTVNGIPVPGEQRFTLCVVEVDKVTGQDKTSTLVKYKITYRYNTNKEIIEITNVEPFYGNRLVKSGTTTFDGYESYLGYESNIYTTIYANYEDVGNLAIDLKKLDVQGNELTGAEYRVQVIKPDGAILERNVKVSNDEIDLAGIMVTEGTQIILTETKAPIGYAVNEDSEIIDVVRIDETGEITLSSQKSNYNPTRMTLGKTQVTQTAGGSLKTEYKAELIDYELDTFKMKLVAIDAETNNPVEGYKFNITSSKGAKKTTNATNKNGETEILVGGHYTSEMIKYNISRNTMAQYYKDINSFEVNVLFDEFKAVDISTLTNNVQTDANYNNTWKIKQVNVTNGNNIEIEVYVEREDALVVEIETIDAVSGNKLTNANYKIQPSIVLSGIGTIDNATQNTIVEVGYVDKSARREYTINTTIPNSYISIPDQIITVDYDEDGNIIEATTTSNIITITSYSGKKINAKVVIEPRQGIQIVNKDYFTGQNIANAEFEVTEEDGRKTTVSNGLTGVGTTLGSKYGNANSTVKYRVHQTKVSSGYATIPDFEIKVTYGDNREITNVELIGTDAEIWVNPSYIRPSTPQDQGYNGNDKGIVKIEINSYYDFRINIKNVDRLNNRQTIAGTNYKIVSTVDTTGNAETQSNGVGTTHLDELKLNKRVIYTITELSPAIDYQPLESKVDVQVEFDEQGFVIPDSVAILEGEEHGEKYATSSGIKPVVNDTDRFTINVQITSNPKFRMNITNVDYFNGTGLPGTEYIITSEVGNSIDNNLTDGNGKTTLRVNGNPSNIVVYTIHENKPSAGYQTLEEDIKIEVQFDLDGVVQSCKVIQGNRFTSADVLQQILTTFDSFTINVQIKSVELLKFEISNIENKLDSDKNETIQPVGTAKYKISAIEVSSNTNLNTDNEATTDNDGNATITMNRALSNKTIKYIITEETVPANYKTIDNNITIEISFDNDGKMIKDTAKIITNDDGSSSVNYATITNVDIDNFTINLKIRNNELVDFIINNISTTTDDNGNTTIDKVPDTTYKISVTEVSTNANLNADKTGSTDINGLTRIGMDRGLDGKTIRYTITQTKKAIGYNWLDSEIIIEVSFDDKGRIIENSWSIVPNSSGVSAGAFVKITNVVIKDYEIYLEIENTPIKEFGIYLVAQDKYTQNKINGVSANAFLTRIPGPQENNVYSSDKVHDFDVINANENYTNNEYKYLYTGADRDNDGRADLEYGEDYLSMGEYLEKAGTRTLRLTLRHVPDVYQYYTYNNGTAQDYAILIDVTFNDEGKPTSAKVKPAGKDEYIGYRADGTYVDVEVSGYAVKVKLKFYPMLYTKLQAVDMYTNTVLGGNLELTTDIESSGAVDEGHVAEGYLAGTDLKDVGNDGAQIVFYDKYSVRNSNQYLRTVTSENNRSRVLAIKEWATPREPEQYYQEYRGGKKSYRIIAKIKVDYNNDGTIQKAEVIEYNPAENVKITNGYVKLEWDEYYLSVKVLYAPTTKVQLKVVDSGTNQQLSGIEIHPFKYGSSPYSEHNSFDKKYTTTSTALTGWTYWGANIALESSSYTIASNINAWDSIAYNYYQAGNVKIDVVYNENGRINSAHVMSKNSFEDALNAEVTWQDTTVYVTIKLDRRFNLKIDKKDLYDSTKNLSGVQFKLSSDKHENATLYSWQIVSIGRVHVGQKVTYDLAEVATPNGYEPLPYLKLYVEFDDNGNVQRMYVDEEYNKYFSVLQLNANEQIDQYRNTTRRYSEIIVRNAPTLGVTVNLTDAFYNNLKLEGGTFTLTNDKGDLASGGLVTNANGTITTSIGKTYPNETVTYTLKQTSIIDSYYANDEIMEFTIEYNKDGLINNYTVTNGINRYTIKPNVYKGTKAITLDVTNDPKDVYIGIVNIDGTTGAGINDVQYKVDIIDDSTNKQNSITYTTQTNASGDGTVAGKVDDFEKSTETRVVTYKISEITIPNTYRKIQDIEIEVFYNQDGSIKTYNVLSNESNVGIKVYPKGSNITKLNGVPTHIKLTIENDNRYDLIIKNEDVNYPGLGIEGTKYDVSIDGLVRNVSETDSNGITRLSKLDGSGYIQIRIAENTVGTGYRENTQNNDVAFILEKGKKEYSLSLIANNNQTNVSVIVDEDHGTVTVTFKNETKLELELIKENIETGNTLSGIPFEIIAQEIDDYGNPSGNITAITQKGVNDTTGNDGRLYFDLGVTPQNKIIKYTINELETPEGYYTNPEMTVTVKFNMYGQVDNISDNSYKVDTATMSDNKNGIIVFVGNTPIHIDPETGEPEPENPVDKRIQYEIKVATVDRTTNKRINGSTLEVGISKDDGTIIVDTMQGTTDDRIRGNIVVEKGIVRLTGLNEEGEIHIDVDQIAAATGYKLSEKTSGTVKINVQYSIDTTTNNQILDLTDVIDDDGFRVVTDNTNREILIIIYNEPGITLNIDKYYDVYELDENNNSIKVQKPVEGAKFTITSEIQTSKQIITTDLYEETKSTNSEGKLTTGLGEPQSGKTVLYTLKETVPEGYKEMEDIVILVQYNTSGLIKYVEVLSDEDITEVTNTPKGTRQLNIRVKNTSEASNKSYKVILRKHSIENGEYDYLIPDTEYRITVQEEYGTERTWTNITDENGMITSASFTGYGRIKVIYTELTAANGYQKDGNTYEIEVNRDKETGIMSEYSSSEGYEIDEINNIIYVDPKDELQNERYNLFINKIDKTNNNRILNNPAIFNVNLIQTQEVITEDEEGNIVNETQEISTFLGTVKTNKEGIAALNTLTMPSEEGIYKIKLTETQSPEGYIANEDGYYISVTFERDSVNEIMRITNVENLSLEDVDIITSDEQVIKINVRNEKKSFDILENQIVLDVTKVDSNTKEAITNNLAIFKLTYEDGTREYIETNIEDGKLKIPYFELPSEDEFEENETVERKYELTEIMAPEGYLIDSTPINVNIVFKKNDDGEIIIQKVEVLKGKNSIEVTEKNRVIAFNIENTEGQLINNADRGTYTINLSKVETETQEPVTGHATFEITLENGEKLTASTDENGNIQIKDIKVPATVVQNLGPYSYVIQETRPADGYELIEGYTIMELTFKELVDPETGEGTGLYGIDNIENVPTLTVSQSAIITSYTEENVNIVISNDLSSITIKYDANADDNTIEVPEEQQKEIGQDIILDTMVPERGEYIFKGWATKEDATEAEYQPGDIFTLNKDTTLYAVWEEKLYLSSTEYLIGTGVNSKEEWAPGEISKYEEGDLYIKGIRPQAGIRLYATQVPPNYGTYLDELLDNLNTNADEVKVYIPEKDFDGNNILKEENVVGDNRLIGTAMIIKLTKGEQEIQLTLIVRGDLIATGSTVGDGKVTNVEAARLTTLNNYTLTTDYTVEEQQAIDYYLNTDNRWSTNKQAIVRAYQEHTLESIR